MNVYAIQTALKHGFESSKTKFILKCLWVLPLFTVFIYLLSSMFIESVKARLIISFLLSIFPWYELMNVIFKRNVKHLRTQLLVLLQVLCTSVSSGYSIDKSLGLVRPVIEHTFGNKSILIKPLIELENNLKLHIGLDRSLSRFAQAIDFPETLPIFHALAISGEIGNNTLAILRSSCQMLSEMNAMQNEIAATNAGKNAEALMLCIMPFGITFALNRMSTDYLELARQTPSGKIMLLIAFALCVVSSALLLKYITNGYERKQKKTSADTGDGNFKTPLTDLFKKVLPAGFITSELELFSELSVNPKYDYEKHLRKQIITGAAALLIAFSLIFSLNRSFWMILPVIPLTALLNIRDVKHRVELKREDLMNDIPLFVCLMSTLLEAGMTLPRSLEICSKAFDESQSLSVEIRNLRAQMLSGSTASDAVESMSLRIQIPEAQAALLLIARYGRLGSQEVLNMLTLSATSCWNLCRNAAMKKQEREALGMLIPMTLDFICVLIVATVPAIISLGI